MSGRLAWTAGADDAGLRADVVLGQRLPGVSRRVARELALAGGLQVDGRRAPPSHRVRAGERLELSAGTDADPPALELLACTASCVYALKPAGVHTHRLRPDDPPALADAVARAFPECESAGLDPREAGALHRLDRETSGVVAFARTRAAWTSGRAAFSSGRARKRYAAVTTCPPDHVWPPAPRGWLAVAGARVEISAPLGRGDRRDRVAVRPDGQPALTRVAAEGPPGPRRLWSLELITGRRHQARVHLAWLGLPIVGDTRYGGEPAPRLLLHAHALDLGDPEVGEVSAPLPPELAALRGPP